MKWFKVFMWELRDMTRFPFLELLIGLLVFQVFYASLSARPSLSIGFNFPSIEWEWIQSSMFFGSMKQIAISLVGAYIPVIFVVAVIATMSFAYQFETGLTKTYLSLPVKKSLYFLTKFSVCFLVPFISLIVTGLLTELFLNPPSFFFFFASPEALIGTLLLTAEMVFFVVAVCVAVSLFSRHTAVSLISSLVILYSLQLIRLPILPPTSFSRGLFDFLFSGSNFFFSQRFYWQQYPGLEGVGVLALTPLASLCLVVLSYVYYVRRFEL